MFNSSPLTKSPLTLTVTRWAAALWLETGARRAAVIFKLLISSTYYFQTWLRYVLCLTRAVLIPQRSDKLIRQSCWLQYFGMHYYLFSDVTKSSLHMQEWWRLETDGITLSSPGDSWKPFRACLSLSFSLSLIPPSPSSLFFPVCSSLSLSPYQAGQPLQSIQPLVNNRCIIY